MLVMLLLIGTPILLNLWGSSMDKEEFEFLINNAIDKREPNEVRYLLEFGTNLAVFTVSRN